MIVFLNLKNQICEGSKEFAFYDTVGNCIICFGKQKDQVFDSIEDFVESFREYTEGTKDINRFLRLIPENYFDDFSYDDY